MNETISQLLKTLGITAIFATAATRIMKKFIEQYFSEGIEKYKAELEKENLVHKTKFETLHIERANVIKDVYKKIVDVQITFESLINPLQLAGEPSKEEKTKTAAAAFNAFGKLFDENRLFFTETTAAKIQELRKEFFEIWNKWQLVNELRDSGTKHIKEWGEAWERTRNKIPTIKNEIEEKFRDIIGVT